MSCKVPHAACKAIDPCHHEGVPRPEKVEQDREFGPEAAPRATRFSVWIKSQPAALQHVPP